MTLHEAIKYTIHEIGPAGFPVITAFINGNGLYNRADNKPAPVNQVKKKVFANPDLFKVLNNIVHLHEDSNIKEDLLTLNEPDLVFVPEKDKGELTNMFQQMLDILWESGFKGSPEHHIAALYFFAIIPVVFEKTDFRFNFEEFNKIYKPGEINIINKYLDQLSSLNRQKPLTDIFSLVLNEKKFIVDSLEAYHKLFYLINTYEVTIWKDPYIGGWLTDFISAYSNSDFKGRMYSTPSEIRTILTVLVSTLRFKRLYDPAAGTGSLIAEICRKASPEEIYCQEKNKNIFSLLRMNILSNYSGKTYFSNRDSLKSDFIGPGDAELIVSDLPWDIKKIIKSPGKGMAGSGTEIYTDSLFIEDTLKRLSEKGIAVLNTSFNFLIEQATVKIRKKLIDNDILDTVIAVPSGFYKPFSNLRSAIIVLTKNKTPDKKNKTLFIDLSDLITDKEFPDKLKGIFHNWIEMPEKSAISDSKRISEEGYSFIPSKYLVNVLNIPLRTGESLVSLNSVIEDFRGTNYKWNKNEPPVPFIKVGSLNDSIEEPFLDMNRTELTGSGNPRGTLVSGSALLLSRVGDKLKPQYFNYMGTSVVVNPNILIFSFDTKKIDPEYLVLELKSKYFNDQLQGIRHFSGIPNFSKRDFLKLYIRLPELIKDQKIKVKEQKEVYLGEFEAELKLKKEKLIGKQTQFDLVSTIKHNLSQKLSILSNDLDFLTESLQRSESGIITINKPLNDLTTESILEITRRMTSMINDSKNTLTRTETYIMIVDSENSKKSINIFDFLENDIKPLYKNFQSFSIKIECKPEIKKELIVCINPFHLKELFTNLIQNAIDHGFVDDAITYEIRFLLMIDNKTSKARILVSNNGYPMPGNFSIDTLLKFGEKSGESGGTGIGGAVIGKILELAGGEIRIPGKNELSLSKYIVNFEICLPLC
ncbi:MAG TPA: N-6 DNA methylase [Bacteroidales bacterium]|nr:N-6 DNA methylase [Bacteroidales bacterium]